MDVLSNILSCQRAYGGSWAIDNGNRWCCSEFQELEHKNATKEANQAHCSIVCLSLLLLKHVWSKWILVSVRLTFYNQKIGMCMELVRHINNYTQKGELAICMMSNHIFGFFVFGFWLFAWCKEFLSTKIASFFTWIMTRKLMVLMDHILSTFWFGLCTCITYAFLLS